MRSEDDFLNYTERYMFKRISLNRVKNLSFTARYYVHDLREWFFMIDNKGLLYLEETEPKIYPNAIKDEKFLRMFYKNLEKNNTGRHPLYKYLSMCWGEYNYVRCAVVSPIVFQHLIEENGKDYISYGPSFKTEFLPKELMVDQDGAIYHTFTHPQIKHGIVGSGLAVSLSDKLKRKDDGYYLEWRGEDIKLKEFKESI